MYSTTARNLEWLPHDRWYVIANQSEAVFYFDGVDHRFHFVNRLSNPRAHRMEQDLVTDRPGMGFGAAPHGLSQRISHHEAGAIKFAKKVAKSITEAFHKKRFQELVLVAAPYFLGLLRDKLPMDVRSSIKFELHKEYSQGSDDEIRDHVIKAIEKETGQPLLS